MTRRRGEHGLTLVEVCVAMVATTILGIVAMQTVRGLATSQSFVEGQVRTRAIGERVMQAIQRDVAFSARIMQEDSAGRGLLAKMALADTPLEGSRMPQASALGYFERDPEGKVQAGNLLFILRNEPPELVDLGGSVGIWRCTVYRFVCYYLTGHQEGLDINRWASVRVVRLPDVQRLADEAQRQALVGALGTKGIRYAWDPAAEEPESLFRFSPTSAPERLAAEARLPGAGRQAELRLLHARRAAIAPNGARAPLTVPCYARPTATFPHGFELKVDGTGLGGLLLVRLALVGTSRGGSDHRSLTERRLSFRDE
ncbi:MAG: prepilin-type N-terminal cleavage/methylation domain-containing protein [Planctomycetota bacterium]